MNSYYALVRAEGAFEMIDLRQVSKIELKQSYTCLYLLGKVYRTRCKISPLIARLRESLFFQVSEELYINLGQITQIENPSDSSLSIHLEGEAPPVHFPPSVTRRFIEATRL